MWRPWDRDLQQVQDQWESDKESRDEIPVLSSDEEHGKRTVNNNQDSFSGDDVIIIGDRASPAIHRQCFLQ